MNVDCNSQMYRLVGCCMTVRHELGSGFLESVYEKALMMELEQVGFDVKSQVRIPVFYKGMNLNRDFIADILVDGEIIVELKAVSRLLRVHERQVENYLEATRLRRGLLVNFGHVRGMEWRVLTR